MSIRLRITIALLLIGLIPIGMGMFWADRGLNEVSSLAIQAEKTDLEKAGQDAVREKANSVAAQIELYLKLNPRLTPFNLAALHADSNLAEIAVQPFGETGYTAVHNIQGTSVFHSNPELINASLEDLKDRLPEFWDIVARSLNGNPAEGYYDWLEADGSIRQKYMVIVPVRGTPLLVAATTYVDEFTKPIDATTEKIRQVADNSRTQFAILAFVGAVVAVMGAVYIGARLTAPLVNLAEAANRVAQGDWMAIKPLRDRNEIGILSRSMHAMTEQLRNAIETLEVQVRERTRELTKRTRLLGTASRAARDISRARSLEELLNNAVELIRDRFDFYHAGIFLVDELGEHAVLAAATGEAGQQMLANHHQLRVGATGIVGFVTSTGQPRIALDVGGDSVHFRNPLLPETRSEMALPLKVGQRVIGVLDVQAIEEAAFGEDDVEIMQDIADQLAIAVENMRLVSNLEKALAESSAASQLAIQQAWQRYGEEKTTAFEYNRLQIVPARQDLPAELEQRLRTGQPLILSGREMKTAGLNKSNGSILIVPINLRGQTIGTIGIEQELPDYRWTDEEITMATSIATQAALSLENARLIEESQLRALHEQTISDITAKVSSSVQIETVLRTAAEELGRVLQGSEVLIQLQKGQGQEPRTGI